MEGVMESITCHTTIFARLPSQVCNLALILIVVDVVTLQLPPEREKGVMMKIKIEDEAFKITYQNLIRYSHDDFVTKSSNTNLI